MEKLNHFSTQNLCDFTYFLFKKIYLETQYFTSWEVCKWLSSFQWLFSDCCQDLAPSTPLSCGIFSVPLNKISSGLNPSAVHLIPSLVCYKEDYKGWNSAWPPLRDKGPQRLEWVWASWWSSRLQWGSEEGQGLGTCLMHQHCARCEAVLLGTRATCNNFFYFIYKAAYFRPAGTNIEWHCAQVLINTLHSCNASLGMVFMCNQMRHMSERWQWNPMISYICF